MNILSLFDGMSCGQIALNRIGLKPTKYYASEIDKYAIKVTQANYPDTVQLGDVTNWRKWDIDWSSIDLLMGGSPCQGFSFAGKQLAFDDPRSALFFVYVDILNHIKSVNPRVKFLLENVKMKKEYLAIISDLLGVEPEFINSEDYGPCERPRYYWFNWSFKEINDIRSSVFLEKCVDMVEMSEGWVRWWSVNREFQIKKKYSRLIKARDKGITMTARQYASWNGNFISEGGKFYKPGKRSLAILIGAPECYFQGASQRQSEVLAGNGWTVDVIAHIFSQMELPVSIFSRQLDMFKDAA